MTSSVVWLTLYQTHRDPQRLGEFIFAAFMVIPCSLFPLIAIGRASLGFRQAHAENLTQKPEAYQKWLETYAVREPESQMRDVVIAGLLSPFRADRWFFSLLQLSERLAATVAATCLEDATQWQIGWALAVEAAAMLAEICANPFADKVQKRYNLLWRLLALGILTTALFIEIFPASFQFTGDILLIILASVAVGAFIIALEPGRLYRDYQRFKAVQKFRKSLVLEPQDVKLGNEGVQLISTPPEDEGIWLGSTLMEVEADEEKAAIEPDRKTQNSTTMAGRCCQRTPPARETLGQWLRDGNNGKVVAKSLLRAVELIPAVVGPASVFRDGLTSVQQYQLVLQCEQDEALHQLILFLALLHRVKMLELSGVVNGPHCRIPSAIGAFVNVSFETSSLLAGSGLPFSFCICRTSRPRSR